MFNLIEFPINIFKFMLIAVLPQLIVSRTMNINEMTVKILITDKYATLSCPLDPLRNESATYRWSRGGTVLAACASCSNGTVNITQFAGPVRWMFNLEKDFRFYILRPVLSEDAGLYVCTDEHHHDVIRITLKVLVPARNVTLKTEPKSDENYLFVTEGQNVSLSCSAKGKPSPEVSLQWRDIKLGRIDFNVSRKIGKLNEEDETIARMRFVASPKQNGRTIRCSAETNISGSHFVSKTYKRIQVQNLLNLKVFIIPSEAEEGENVVLFCRSDDTEYVNLTWTKLGSQWTHDAKKAVLLERVSLADAGTYRCTSSNIGRVGGGDGTLTRGGGGREGDGEYKQADLFVRLPFTVTEDSLETTQPFKQASTFSMSILQAVLSFVVLIFVFLMAILAVVIHFVCHSTVYNNSAFNKRRLPTLPAANPPIGAHLRKTSDREGTNTQLSMNQINSTSIFSSSSLLPKPIPPRPKAKLPNVPLKTNLVNTEHSYVNTADTQPDYLEVVDEPPDREDFLYEDPDKNCFESAFSIDPQSLTKSSTITLENRQHVLYSPN